MPKVLHKYKDTIPDDAIYVGRGSPWGNPFVLGPDGDRKTVIRRFRLEILPDLDVSELEGKDLVCFCSPKECHADLLLTKANTPPPIVYQVKASSAAKIRDTLGVTKEISEEVKQVIKGTDK